MPPTPGPADVQHLLLQKGRAEPGQLVSPMPWACLLGELPKLGLNAAVPHAHAGQCGANVPCGTWGEHETQLTRGRGHPHTSPSPVWILGPGWLTVGTMSAGMPWVLGTLWVGGGSLFPLMIPRNK